MAGYPIQIVPYDPSWPAAYQEEQHRLEVAIGKSVIRFEHMGSTAVPGLDSKPIIDISAAVADLSAVPLLFPALEKLGYKPIEQRSKDRFDLWRVCAGPYPSHILHFMKDGSDAWRKPIAFRDALRSDPKLRAEYSELKRSLARRCGEDIDTYGKGKTEFISAVVEETPDGSPDVRATLQRMKSATEYLTFQTDKREEFVCITEQVAKLVTKSGIQEGFCLVSAMHITAAVYVNDLEYGLIEDIKEWLHGIAPDKDYRHHRTGEDNGSSHLKNLILHHQVVLPITAGRLDLGPWQQVFYAEFDGRRKKRVVVKAIGE